MPLPPKVRALMGVTDFLTKVGLGVTPEKIKATSMEKRLASAPPKWSIDPHPADVIVTDHETDSGIRVRLFRVPANTPQPFLLYIHGGGWSVGGFPSTDHITARLAHDTGIAVLAVEYRLAPEHPYPAALEDLESALAWADAHAGDLGFDMSRLAVGGDSAGGNLAAALTLRLRDSGRPLSAQLLIYPALDATMSTPSGQSYSGPGAKPAALSTVWDWYAGGADRANPEISPLLAPDVSGLPPTLVMTAAYDVLHDEGEAYAVRLREAGVPTTFVDHPDWPHAFFSLPKLYPGIDKAWQTVADFLRRNL
ncbi:MAG TPA: alpha/beta hydrolase [Phycicoccus sp.]|nr:alpha/beta hydrolase [Phycicoccus sp.]HQY95735.1 alpha/beta hydrolase [Phycicoccus sp.]